MAQPPTIERPLRVGVFGTVAEADRAVENLIGAGFTKDDITVVCSDAAVERHFQEFQKQEPAGTFTPAAAASGGAIGAVLGGLAAVAGGVATGGIGLVATAGIAAWAGGIFGGLVGAMMSRGVEKELANYYQQAVIDGDILVAVEVDEDSSATPRRDLACASQALAEAGAKPLKLREG
ncbi:MAG: general stress protein [Pirellulales bacterium]